MRIPEPNEQPPPIVCATYRHPDHLPWQLQSPSASRSQPWQRCQAWGRRRKTRPIATKQAASLDSPPAFFLRTRPTAPDRLTVPVPAYTSRISKLDLETSNRETQR